MPGARHCRSRGERLVEPAERGGRLHAARCSCSRPRRHRPAPRESLHSCSRPCAGERSRRRTPRPCDWRVLEGSWGSVSCRFGFGRDARRIRKRLGLFACDSPLVRLRSLRIGRGSLSIRMPLVSVRMRCILDPARHLSLDEFPPKFIGSNGSSIDEHEDVVSAEIGCTPPISQPASRASFVAS